MGVHNKPSPPCFHVSSCDLLAQLKAVSSCSYVTGFLFTEFRRVLYCQYHFFHGCNWKNVFTVRLLWSKTALIVDTHFFSSLQPHVFPYMEKQCYSIFIQIDHKMATFCFVVPFNSRWQLLLPSIDLQKKKQKFVFFLKVIIAIFSRAWVGVCVRAAGRSGRVTAKRRPALALTRSRHSSYLSVICLCQPRVERLDDRGPERRATDTAATTATTGANTNGSLLRPTGQSFVQPPPTGCSKSAPKVNRSFH